MLLVNELLVAKNDIGGKIKKGDQLTVEVTGCLEVSRNGEYIGQFVIFKEHPTEIFPISIFENGNLKTRNKTEKQILNWFK
jgi:hypothetical protein